MHNPVVQSLLVGIIYYGLATYYRTLISIGWQYLGRNLFPMKISSYWQNSKVDNIWNIPKPDEPYVLHWFPKYDRIRVIGAASAVFLVFCLLQMVGRDAIAFYHELIPIFLILGGVIYACRILLTDKVYSPEDLLHEVMTLLNLYVSMLLVL